MRVACAMMGGAVGLASTLVASSVNAQTKLQAVFDRDMLDAQVAYLEGIVGPAWRVYPGTRAYKVDGCVVTIGVSGSKIRNLHMDISPKCTFDLNAFVGNYHFPRLDRMTFGQFEQPYLEPQFQASCIYLCGNAADPVVRDYWAAPHSENFIEIAPEVALVGEEAINASMAWQAARCASRIQSRKPPLFSWLPPMIESDSY